MRYPNGQTVIYFIAGENLPRIGRPYVFFLTRDKKTPNYQIVTGYEIKESIIVPLDSAIQNRDFKERPKLNFMNDLREKASSREQDEQSEEQ